MKNCQLLEICQNFNLFSYMAGIRTWTDEHIFGKDPQNRNVVQAATRDFTHGVFHVGEAIGDFVTGKDSSQNWKRAGDHFTGENIKQRKGSDSGSG